MANRQEPLKESATAFTGRISREVREYMLHLDRSEAEILLAKIRQDIDAESAALLAVESIFHAQLAKIAVSSDYLELGAIQTLLTELEIARFEAVPSVPALHYGCTHYRDLIAARTMALVEIEMVENGSGPAPLSYSLISMGSDGRMEQTLITDQDYLIVYGNGGSEVEDAYFESFSSLLVERLAEVGFKKCTGGIMPSNPTWRGSVQQWNRRILAIVRYEFDEYAKNMMDLIVISDARYVAGDRGMAEALVELIRDFERNYFQVIWGMAKAATEMQVGLGWFGRLWTDRKGEYQGLFNVKLLGWAPLVMNVRILAVNSGVIETNTIRRINRLEEARSLSPESAEALREAYLLLTCHRILLQIRALRGLQDNSHYLDPKTLTVKEVEALRNALHRIEELQKIIHTNFTIL